MKCIKKLVPLAVATAISAPALFTPMAVQAEAWTGNIGIHSKYLLRGIFEENDDAAIQGGIDYSGANGFYAGWWGSSLGYTYEAPADTKTDVFGFENDFYAGFSGEFSEGIGWSVGFIQYLYLNVDDSNLTELTGDLSFGPFSVGVQYLVTDGWWGNSGDAYWKLGYSADLPKDFSFSAKLGYYSYDDDDNAELGGCGGVTPCTVTTNSSGFRHLDLTISHPIANTGADAYAQFTVAGEDRTNTDYNDSIVFGITYGFDL